MREVRIAILHRKAPREKGRGPFTLGLVERSVGLGKSQLQHAAIADMCLLHFLESGN